MIIGIRNQLNDLALIAGKFSTENSYEVAQTVEFAIEVICDDKHIKPQLHSEYDDHLQHKTYRLFRELTPFHLG